MKKYLLSFAVLVAAFAITSCSSDDEEEAVIIEDTETAVEEDSATSSNLALVLNEGAYYYSIDGSLSVIDLSESSITNGVFQSVNSRSLGGTPNSICLAESTGELYIAVTDENRVEIIDQDYASVAYVSITQPRELCYADDYVYVSSYDGSVYMISTENHTVSAQSDTVGACLEGIAARNGYVYVCNAYNADYTYNTNVVKLNASTLAKVSDVTVADNPTSLKLVGDDLYLLSTGNYWDVNSQLQIIDSSDNVSYICDATLFDVVDSTVYTINSVTDWTTYESVVTYSIISGGKSTDYTPCYDLVTACALAVNPATGKIFVSSYNLSSYGYADYSGDCYVVEFGSDFSSYSNVYTAGVGATNILFLVD